MDCRVVVEAAIPVYDVGSADEAVRIAISKTGDMLNPDLNYVEIDMGERSCPHCGEPHEPAFVAADEALVALELEMTVFNVEDEEHASRIARKEMGQRMRKVPLDVLTVDVVEEDEDEDDADGDDAGGDDAGEARNDTDGVPENPAAGDSLAGDAEVDADADEDADGDSTSSASGSPVAESGADESGGTAVDGSDDGTDADSDLGSDADGGRDDVLPEFEDLIDER